MSGASRVPSRQPRHGQHLRRSPRILEGPLGWGATGLGLVASNSDCELGVRDGDEQQVQAVIWPAISTLQL